MNSLRKLQQQQHEKKIESNFKPFKDAPIIKEDEISMKEKIGEGAFATVWKASCRGCLVAVKVPLLKEGQIDPKKLETFNSEIQVMSKLYHPRIALFMGAFVDPKNIKIVSELLQDFSLLLMNKKNVVGFSLYERMIYAVQAAEGMNWLHGANIIHCDFKPSNLLWDKKTNSVKVCDFGMSQLIETEDILSSQKIKGSPLYMAPEVVKRKGITKSADVYSFAISLYQFITRKEPFEEYSNLDVFLKDLTREENPVRPELPTDEIQCPKSLRKLCENCWDTNPEKRPGFDRILQRFDEVLIDCAIFDRLGKMFWMANFVTSEGLQTSVKWEEFQEKWVDFFNSGEPFPEDKPYQRVFKRILCQSIDGEEVIELKHFGEILGFFPPLTNPGTDQESNWVFLVSQIVKEDWFWGDVDKNKAHDALCNQNEGTFLIRFSSSPSDFTLTYVHSKKVIHSRIAHTYHGNKYQGFDSLASFVEAFKKSGKIISVCTGSPYAFLFEDDLKEGGGYHNLDIDDEEEDDDDI
eukprot:TRINITY_DN13624_c0_g1_i1.p1 TRINITY_DN13624_c0_g1~~TRINITY_DN13624_c0_g1_i1.p1  ORF type:complete len:522 (-),score=142.88 TRINITY_DN13624_c0_g1_i1:19-1584(-)